MFIISDEEARKRNRNTFDNIEPGDFFHADHIIGYDQKYTTFKMPIKERMQYYCINKDYNNDYNIPPELKVFAFTKKNQELMVNEQPLVSSKFTFDEDIMINYS